MSEEFRVIGKRPWRPDGVEKVTGRAAYGADFALPGMLFGAVTRSPHAHARILGIDTSKAEAAPGVKAVITCADFPEISAADATKGTAPANFQHLSDNLMAREKVLYDGAYGGRRRGNLGGCRKARRSHDRGAIRGTATRSRR